MDTKIDVNNETNVDIEGEDSPDEAQAELMVQKMIETKDTKCEKLMSLCSDRAKEIRNKINEMLESRDAIVNSVSNESNDCSDGSQSTTQIDTKSLLKLQKELELEISGLNKSSKDNTNEEKSRQTTDDQKSIETNDKSIETKDSIEVKDSDNSIQITAQKTDDTNGIPLNESKTTQKTDSNPKTDESLNNRKTETNVEKSPSKSIAINSSRNKSKNNSKNSRLSVENISKKLSAFGSDAERISYLTNSLVEVSEENRNLIQQSKQNERTTNQLSKERDQMQSEQNRLVLAKSRLESLCRELQRQNKFIKEESLLKIKEEEEKRREIANKFQSTLNEIMQLIGENQKRNTQLKEENADLAQKLKTLMGHYESWEKHTEKIIKQKDLETQLIKAKFAKTDMILNQEKQIFIKEKQQLIQMITDLQKRCADMSQNEIKLRTELGVYTNKYDEFQTVLTKSNDMFANFKRDMERMSKQIKKLEKETLQWKNRWETSNKALLKLSDEVFLYFKYFISNLTNF